MKKTLTCINKRHFSWPTFVVCLCSLACGESSSPPQEFLQEASPLCSDLVIKDQFLVHWKSGEFTLESVSHTEDFKNHFLRIHSEQIIRAEPHYRIPMTQWNPSPENKNICQDALLKNWGLQSIQVSQIWEEGVLGENITIAIIDSGVDVRHPQLEDNIFINTGETGIDHRGLDKTHNGIDDDNNGYIDDVHGYDFINLSPYPIDNLGHGTHVAGIVAAHGMREPESDSVYGVAPGATVLPLKFIDDHNGGNVWAAIKAIDYAVQMGAKIINASWGGSLCSKHLKERIVSLLNQDILFISAAGNHSQNLDQVPLYPASYDLPTQITVGALKPLGGIASFSNYGDRSVHIFAPGQSILSTVPVYFGSFTSCSNGTSMATPFVSGAAALLWSLHPQVSAIDIKKALLFTTTPRTNTQRQLNLSEALHHFPLFIPLNNVE